MRGATAPAGPSTGDYAGDLLYSTLLKFGFAQAPIAPIRTTGCISSIAAIANAVRCLPPENKPLPVEFTECRPFLQAELAMMLNLRVMWPWARAPMTRSCAP